MEKYQLVYKIGKELNNIRLLGKEFFNRNKSTGHFIYKNKKFRLIETFETKNIKEDILNIDLIFYKKIINKSYMFKECESLLKFDIHIIEDKQYYSQIINFHEEEENLFDFIYEDEKCDNYLYKNLNSNDSLTEFSLIHENQKKLTDFSTIRNFYNTLQSIPNNKKNSISFTEMFCNCKSLQ